MLIEKSSFYWVLLEIIKSDGGEVQFCYVPKHAVGEQLLQVREAKREQAAYESAAIVDR